MTSMPRASAHLSPRSVLVRLAIVACAIALLGACRPMSGSEADLFSRTNELRAANGLPVLEQHPELMDQARSWAKGLAARQQLAHSDPHSWNVAWTAVAENVGASTSMGDLFARLEASAGHRAHMVSTKYTHLAVGTATGKDGKIYAVQLFWRG